MNNSIVQFLALKGIFAKEGYLNAIPNVGSKTQAQIFNLLLKEDIALYIDTVKAKQHIDVSVYDFNTKVSFTPNNKVFFAQIQGYSNIAEPIGNCDKDEDNLDVLEKTESKFLQGDDDAGKKIERIIYKFQLSDGVKDFFGFEYEPMGNFHTMLKDYKTIGNNQYPKVMIGPNVEVRRGVFYFKKNNLRIVDEMK